MNENMKKEMTGALKELLRFKSVKYDGFEKSEYEATPGKPFGEGIAAALEYALALCDSMGFKTRNCNGYVGYAEIGKGDEMLGILCHLDVVPEGSGWDYPPFDGTLADGKIYGRGAIDDKGPAIAALFGVKRLIDEGFEFNKRVRLIFGTDEENDWEDMDYYTAHEKHPTIGFTPDADFPLIYGEMGILQADFIMEDIFMGDNFIVGGEASNMVADNCSAHLLMKSGDFVDFTADGAAAHASTPDRGDNAISKLMNQLGQKIEQLECGEALKKFIQFYNDKIGFDLHGGKMGCGYSDEPTGKLTFNAGVVKAKGDKIVLSVDLRCPVTVDKEVILADMKNAAEGYGMKVDNVEWLKPVFSDKDSRLVKILMSVYKELTGDDSQPLTMGGGTYARAMDNIVAFGPLFPGREMVEHCNNEYILEEDLYKISEIYYEAVKRLCLSD